MFQNIVIVGNVGRDASIKYLKDGTAVSDFSVAVSKTTGRGDAKQQKTTWFKATVWRERGELAAQLVKKGAKILVTGEVSATAYVDKAGETQVSLEITVDKFQLLSSKAEMEGDHEGGGSTYGRRSQAEQDMIDNADEIPF